MNNASLKLQHRDCFLEWSLHCWPGNNVSPHPLSDVYKYRISSYTNAYMAMWVLKHFPSKNTWLQNGFFFSSHIHKYLPCIACINTEGNLDRKRIGTDVDADSNRYDNAAEAYARAIAARPPKRSPNLPYSGPPANCTTANVVCR